VIKSGIENLLLSKTTMKILILLYRSGKPLTRYQLMKRLSLNYSILSERLESLKSIGFIEVYSQKPIRYKLSEKLKYDAKYKPLLEYLHFLSNFIRL